jgi:hypothetical protein
MSGSCFVAASADEDFGVEGDAVYGNAPLEREQGRECS